MGKYVVSQRMEVWIEIEADSKAAAKRAVEGMKLTAHLGKDGKKLEGNWSIHHCTRTGDMNPFGANVRWEICRTCNNDRAFTDGVCFSCRRKAVVA
tara:strand:+ start:282 stop:569 length:288 start_codon:yes stop_codon:yes gene_type:complete